MMAQSKQIPGNPSGRPGIAVEDLVVGKFVTVSVNKCTADRSLADAIWEVVAVNNGHVLLKFHGPGRPLDPARSRRLAPLQEYDFYDACHLAAAIEPAASPPIAIVRTRD
jgi:hypothetical protein